MCTITAGARRRLERENLFMSHKPVEQFSHGSRSFSLSRAVEVLRWCRINICVGTQARATTMQQQPTRCAAKHTLKMISMLALFLPILLTDDANAIMRVFCACCSAAPAGERPPQRDGARQTQAEAHVPLRRQPAAPHRVVQARSADRALQEVQNCNKKVSNLPPDILFYFGDRNSPDWIYCRESSAAAFEEQPEW
jgi:hypothetical protein